MKKILFVTFLLGLVIRFLFFPDNIYFGFDQARDSFIASGILKGDLKIIGPPTTIAGLNHGPLYYYLYSPFYFFSGGDPSYAAGFLRVVNALGIFMVFLIGKAIFNKYVGLISALLFAISFEQTQFAIYFNHPSLGVFSVLLLYLGLSLLIFQRKIYGLSIAAIGLGLSIQFEFVLVYLVALTLLVFFLFRKDIPKISLRNKLKALLLFLICIATFIAAEIKFHFRIISTAGSLLGQNEKSPEAIISTFVFEAGRMIKYNLTGLSNLENLLGLVLLIGLIYLILKKKFVSQLKFLSIWFFSSLVMFFISGGSKDLTNSAPLYYHNMGISVSLLLFAGFLIWSLFHRSKIGGVILILAIILNNLMLVLSLNPKGSMPEINTQSGMLLGDEKKVLDYIYSTSLNQPFAVKGITNPFLINTTWSYLFEWYGKSKYGYLPVWNGKNAFGYSGNLEVLEQQEKLPEKRFLIIEPTRGIPPHLINSYMQDENYFTKVIEEKKIGDFVIQKRQPY